MIVEFAGLPGSGKSTVAAGLLTALETEGAAPIAAADLATDPGTLYSGRLRAVARHARFAAAVARLAWRSPRSRRERCFLVRTVAVMLHRFDESKKLDETRVVVFHEGMVQRSFLSLVEAEGVGSQADIDRYLRHAPRPDVVVLLRVSPHMCLDRLERRARGVPERLSELSTHDAVERLRDAGKIFDLMLRRMVSEGDSTNVLCVDGEGQGVLNRVVEALQPVLETTAR